MKFTIDEDIKNGEMARAMGDVKQVTELRALLKDHASTMVTDPFVVLAQQLPESAYLDDDGNYIEPKPINGRFVFWAGIAVWSIIGFLAWQLWPMASTAGKIFLKLINQ